MSKVRYSKKAVEDLSSIWRYTVRKWSEKQADRYYQNLITACNHLMDSSLLSSRRYQEIAPDLFGVKSGHHIIFYKTISENDIFIIRILHEKMDIKGHLQR